MTKRLAYSVDVDVLIVELHCQTSSVYLVTMMGGGLDVVAEQGRPWRVAPSPSRVPRGVSIFIV